MSKGFRVLFSICFLHLSLSPALAGRCLAAVAGAQEDCCCQASAAIPDAQSCCAAEEPATFPEPASHHTCSCSMESSDALPMDPVATPGQPVPTEHRWVSVSEFATSPFAPDADARIHSAAIASPPQPGCAVPAYIRLGIFLS